MRQQPQHYQSTKIDENNIASSIDMTAPQVQANTIYIKPINLTGLLCTNQTGVFPITSNKGNRYVMVAHHFDTNAIFARPLRSCSKLHLQKVFQFICETLKDAGHKPTSI